MATGPSRLQLKTASIEESAPESKGALACFVKPLSGQAGHVFAVMNIAHSSPQAELVGEIVLEQIDRASATVQAGANVQHRFEQVLEAINEQIANTAAELESTIPAESVSALVGIASDNIMFLSGTGDMTALFLHRMPDDRYQVFNLFRSIQTERARPSWQKLFAVVLDGDLHAGDIFCVSNRPLQQEIAPETLNAILTSLPPQSAAAKLRQEYPETVDLTLFVLKASAQEETSGTKPPAKTSADSSLRQLGASQTQTKKILEDQRPSMKLAPIAWIGRFARAHRSEWRGIAFSLMRLVTSSVLVAIRILTGLIGSSVRFAKRLAGSDRKELLRSTRERADGAMRASVSRFNRLPKTSKYLLLAFIAICSAIALSVMFLSRSEAEQAQVAAYEALVNEVEVLRDKATGALIYRDEAQARSFLMDATAKLNALPTDTPERQARADALRREINAALDEVRHVVNIPEPPQVADVGLSTNGVGASTLVFDGSALWVLASDSQAYRVNMANKSLEPVAQNIEVNAAKEATAENGVITFIDTRPGLSQFDGTTLTSTDTVAGENERWTDLYSYGARIYVLNPGGGGVEPQILRYGQADGVFSAPTSWIKASTTDLSDAVSLSVDGTVFVLKQNGTIVRFTSGSEVGWTQGSVEPTLVSPSDLWTDATSDYVYVLDPASQRLVVYEKESGNVVIQYRSDAFVGLTDFAVDETSKSLYLLASGKVFRIDASHIE